MEQAVGQRRVGARRELQVQRRAACAVGVRRGSATISRPPRARCSSKYCIIGGIVSAGLVADEQDRLGPGDVRERERQAAVDAEAPCWRAAAADAMQKRPL